MKKTILALSLVLGGMNSVVMAQSVTVEKHVVNTDSIAVPYQGEFAKSFAGKLPLGIGSGLAFIKQEGEDLLFTAITDRGPNADAPKTTQGQDTKIFVTPTFTPTMVDIRVGPQGVRVSNARVLHDEKGPISGLPLESGLIGSTQEVALSDQLRMIRSDNRGMDTEGIVLDKAGNFYIVDEYGPFLAHVNGQGKILKKWGPSPKGNEKSVATGLPNIIKWRQANRGFEGVAALPNGKIMAAVQSTLDIDGQTKNQARFTRLVEFDPKTGKSRMFAYPIHFDDYEDAKQVKIGDMVAISNSQVLLVDQGMGKNKQMVNKIYLVDFAKATELGAMDAKGLVAEFMNEDQLQQHKIHFAKTEEVVNLRALGWMQEKAEGLALIDKNTLAIINDNDFGVSSRLVNEQGQKEKTKDYRVNEQGQLFKNGELSQANVMIEPLNTMESSTELWLLKLPKALPI